MQKMEATILVFGVMVVLALLAMLGIDRGKVLAKGPRWLRVLLAVALATWNGAGIATAKEAGMTSINENTAGGSFEAWKSTDAGRRIEKAKAAAQKAIERESYPSSVRERENILKPLAEALKDVEQLEKDGSLDPATAEMERGNLGSLQSSANRETEEEKKLPRPTCYAPLPPVEVRAAGESLGRLQARLPLLEKLAEAKTLNPVALREILDSFQGDLGILANRQYTVLRSVEEQSAMKAISKKVEALMKQLQNRKEMDALAEIQKRMKETSHDEK